MPEEEEEGPKEELLKPETWSEMNEPAKKGLEKLREEMKPEGSEEE